MVIIWHNFPKGVGLLIIGGQSSDQWCEGGSLKFYDPQLICSGLSILVPVLYGHIIFWDRLVGVLGVEAYSHRHAKNTDNIEPLTILMTHG